MATPADPEFQDRLQALRDKYAASVPERMAAIRDALALCQGGLSPPHIDQLHHALHSVAGSAGSFGFHALGGEARRIEFTLTLQRVDQDAQEVAEQLIADSMGDLGALLQDAADNMGLSLGVGASAV